MKRPARRSPGSKAKRSPARKAARAAPGRPASTGKAAARRATAGKGALAARRKATPRRPARQSIIQAPEGERQLSDPVEAAQEDLGALPERPLFEPDGSGRDDDLAELLGEEYVRSVTSGEEQGVELRDAPVPEEDGGPFVETSAAREFGSSADDGEPEALPTTRRPVTRQLR